MRKFYYFCSTKFKGSGTYWYNEIVCVKMYPNDPDFSKHWQKHASKGHIIEIDYTQPLAPKQYDLEWEKQQIWKNYRYNLKECRDIIIFTDDVEMK